MIALPIPTFGETSLVYSEDIKGTFEQTGIITITGKMYQPELWKIGIAKKISENLGAPGKYILDNYRRIDWRDIFAIYLVSEDRFFSPTHLKYEFKAGKREFDALSLSMIAKQIADSGGKKDWNAIMSELNEKDPLPADDQTQPESPFNPISEYFDKSKPIFSYDPDFGYIIYKSGEIVWTKTGKRYFKAENGQAVSYDKWNQRVLFASGSILDLRTLKLTTQAGNTTVVSNEVPVFEKIVKSLFTDTKTQLTVLGLVVLLLVIKAKRKKRYEK